MAFPTVCPNTALFWMWLVMADVFSTVHVTWGGRRFCLETRWIEATGYLTLSEWTCRLQPPLGSFNLKCELHQNISSPVPETPCSFLQPLTPMKPNSLNTSTGLYLLLLSFTKIWHKRVIKITRSIHLSIKRWQPTQKSMLLFQQVFLIPAVT